MLLVADADGDGDRGDRGRRRGAGGDQGLVLLDGRGIADVVEDEAACLATVLVAVRLCCLVAA